MRDLPSIDSIAANANDLVPAGARISAGYIGNLEWAPRRDDRSWRFFKRSKSLGKCESWPYGGVDSEDALAELAIVQVEQFNAWVQAPLS
jgi:hypothetical protein